MIQKQISNPLRTINDLFLGSFFNLDDVSKINRHIILNVQLISLNIKNQLFNSCLINKNQLILRSSSPIVIDLEVDSNQKTPDEQQQKVQKQELINLAQYQNPTEEQLNCPYFVCKKTNQIVLKPLALRCAVCKNYFHISCLRIEKPKKVFVCSECILIGMDPLHELQESILDPVIFQSLEGRVNQFTQKFEMKKGLQQDHQQYLKQLQIQYLIELRSIKIDGQFEDICWPDYGDLQLNGKKIQDFKPLANNSCLKKRKDEKLLLNVEQGQVSVLTIREQNETQDLKCY